MANSPSDREFSVQARGYVRDNVVLSNFREGLRKLKNPETGQLFTEDEIRRATQPGSHWYNEAQAVDDYAQACQRKALFIADQLDSDKACTSWLRGYHAPLWGISPLPATGGAGFASGFGTPGTQIRGSTTLGDANAHKARDSQGNIYQVAISKQFPASGPLTGIAFRATTTGSQTNKDPGEILTWINKDPGMDATVTVWDQGIQGGTDPESDAELNSRIKSARRYKEGGGNDAQVRAWAREAYNAIEDAFIYPIAFGAGTTLIAITKKRSSSGSSNSTAPDQRVAYAGFQVLEAAIAQMSPPGSPVMPSIPWALVTSVVPEPTSATVRIAMQRGAKAGWKDLIPFPSYAADTPKVLATISQTQFTMSANGDATLPGKAALSTATGAAAPNMMLWNRETSEFMAVSIKTITQTATHTYSVELNSNPGVSIEDGIPVCPATDRSPTISAAARSYFDSLGPGEIVDLSNSSDAVFLSRFPFSTDEWPYRAGGLLATRLIEALGGSSSDAELSAITKSAPSLPTDISKGPNMLTLDMLGVYPL